MTGGGGGKSGGKTPGGGGAPDTLVIVLKGYGWEVNQNSITISPVRILAIGGLHQQRGDLEFESATHLFWDRRGLSPSGRFPPSFIHQVVILTILNKL